MLTDDCSLFIQFSSLLENFSYEWVLLVLWDVDANAQVIHFPTHQYHTDAFILYWFALPFLLFLTRDGSQVFIKFAGVFYMLGWKLKFDGESFGANNK